MKKIILLLPLFFASFLSGDYLDLSVETKSNYHFEDYYFKDINTTNTKKLEKELSYNEFKASGNFNNIIGFNYSKNFINDPDSFESKEIYLGSDKTKFLGYERADQKIIYGARRNKAQTVKYTIYDILTIEKSKLDSVAIETFLDPTATTTTDTVYRTMDYEKVTLTSENLYNHVRENAIDGETYFYGVAGAFNSHDMFRIYGVMIASYEQHDYSNGKADYLTDVNGTQTLVSIFDVDADTQKLLPKDGRFKGYGYGYKVTAEAYWKDFSLFVTSYYKKTSLKNYHTDIKNALPDADPLQNVIANDKISFLQQYTSFGLRYRF